MLCATLPERLGKTGTACYNTECAYSLLEVVEIMEFVLGRVHFGCDIDSYQDEKKSNDQKLIGRFCVIRVFPHRAMREEKKSNDQKLKKMILKTAIVENLKYVVSRLHRRWPYPIQ